MSHLNINGVDKPLDHIKIKAVVKGLSEPLCGIGTYKDTLDLSTGMLTRCVKKMVLTGTEDWAYIAGVATNGAYYRFKVGSLNSVVINAEEKCTHYQHKTISSSSTDIGFSMQNSVGYNGAFTAFRPYSISSESELATWKSYLAAQYAAGHPVTIWYVLATPETETVTVPSHLTGTLEGYLTQTGTPTPTNPIYPTANGEEESGGTYSIDTGEYIEAWEARDKSNHLLWGRADTFTGTNSISARCYGLPVKSWEIDGNSQQSGVPAPDNIIMPEFVGVRTENLFDVQSPSEIIRTNFETLTDGGIGIRIQNQIWSTLRYSDIAVVQGASYIMAVIVDEYSGNSTFVISVRKNSIEGEEIIKDTIVSAGVITHSIIADDFSKLWIGINLNNSSTQATATAKVRVMLNTGSTPLPFEPYGWAIEIEVT